MCLQSQRCVLPHTLTYLIRNASTHIAVCRSIITTGRSAQIEKSRKWTCTISNYTAHACRGLNITSNFSETIPQGAALISSHVKMVIVYPNESDVMEPSNVTIGVMRKIAVRMFSVLHAYLISSLCDAVYTRPLCCCRLQLCV